MQMAFPRAEISKCGKRNEQDGLLIREAAMRVRVNPTLAGTLLRYLRESGG